MAGTQAGIAYEQIRATFARHGEREQLALIDRLAGGGGHVRQALIRMWKEEPKPSILRWTIEAMCAFRDPECTAIVQQAMRHPNMSVRLHAASGIHKRGRTDLMEGLKELLNDPSGGVRLRAITILCANQVAGMDPHLLAATQDEKEYIRRFALNALSGVE